MWSVCWTLHTNFYANQCSLNWEFSLEEVTWLSDQIVILMTMPLGNKAPLAEGRAICIETERASVTSFQGKEAR